MKEEVFDIAIVGGGVVGSATFYQLQKAFPTKKLVLIEKESKSEKEILFCLNKS